MISNFPVFLMAVPVQISTADPKLHLTKLSGLFSLSNILTYLLTGCLVMGLWLTHMPAALADADTAELFTVHCAGCHPNGANIIRRGKNLKQRALKRNSYDSVDEIATLITNGKGLMSAYGDQLSPDEINHLASYVLEQAAINWKSAK